MRILVVCWTIQARERSLRVFSFLLPVSALLHGPKYLLVEKDANFGCLSSLPSPLRLGQTLQEQLWQDLSFWTITINFKHIYKRRATDLDDFIGCGCDDADVWDSSDDDDDDDDDQDSVLPGVTQVSQNVACTTLA